MEVIKTVKLYGREFKVVQEREDPQNEGHNLISGFFTDGQFPAGINTYPAELIKDEGK